MSNSKQMVHVAMINSFNVLTGKSKVIDVTRSSVGFFAHDPIEPINDESINMMISYFESKEMYEHCQALNIIKLNKEFIETALDEGFKREDFFNNDICQCEMPDIQDYKKEVRCSSCKKVIDGWGN